MANFRICFIGDSFVNGTGDPNCLGWTGRIVADACHIGHDITYYNLGVRRDTSTDIARRWLPEVSHRLPAECNGRVVFSFGANDATIEGGKTRVKFADSLANCREILEKAKKLYPVLMVSAPPLCDRAQNLRIFELSNHFAEICTDLDIPFLDVFTPLMGMQTWMEEAELYDGAHPRNGGYAEFAKLVQNWGSWLSWLKEN